MARVKATATLDMSGFAPLANRYSMLEYQPHDPLEDNKPTVTWLVGNSADCCEERWSLVFDRGASRSFEIPGIFYKVFLIHEGGIWVGNKPVRVR